MLPRGGKIDETLDRFLSSPTTVYPTFRDGTPLNEGDIPPSKIRPTGGVIKSYKNIDYLTTLHPVDEENIQRFIKKDEEQDDKEDEEDILEDFVFLRCSSYDEDDDFVFLRLSCDEEDKKIDEENKECERNRELGREYIDEIRNSEWKKIGLVFSRFGCNECFALNHTIYEGQHYVRPLYRFNTKYTDNINMMKAFYFPNESYEDETIDIRDRIVRITYLVDCHHTNAR